MCTQGRLRSCTPEALTEMSAECEFGCVQSVELTLWNGGTFFKGKNPERWQLHTLRGYLCAARSILLTWTDKSLQLCNCYHKQCSRLDSRAADSWQMLRGMDAGGECCFECCLQCFWTFPGSKWESFKDYSELNTKAILRKLGKHTCC